MHVTAKSARDRNPRLRGASALVESDHRSAGRVVFIDEPDLVRAIRRLAPGAHIVILPTETPAPLASAPPAQQHGSDANRANLTRREHDVLERVATGETNAEIADAMGLARNTVKAYLQSLMRKLGARNRIEALTYARTHGMI